jgi:cell division septum initiation protein DivIVA
MPDRPEQEAGAATETGGRESHADVGGKVNAIIAAAETAAEEIGQDASRKASETLREAKNKAAARIKELTGEAARLRDEADQYARDIREAADSYGTQHRQSVEKEARRLLADAEDEATKMREAAQRKVEEIEREVGQRHATLRRQAKMLEERNQRVLEGLRDLAAQLQDALVGSSEQAPQEESLVDALDVDRRR